MSTRTTPFRPAPLWLEPLEAREVPAITIVVDYTYDLRSHGGSGFFEDNPDAKAVMNRVAQEMGQRVDANLSAISPGGSNSWAASFFNPATGRQVTLNNLRVAADTIVVYAGGRSMPGAEAGQGGYGGYGWSGSSGWGNTVAARGWSGFAPWGGSIAFDTTENWHLGLTTSGLDPNELDFYSVALHELGHLMGIGTAPQWTAKVRNGTFVGGNATALYGGPVPLQSGGAHWADGVVVGGQSVSLDPVMNFGSRVTWSSLDQAALRDIGWAAGSPASPPPASPPPASPPPASPPPASPPPASPPPASPPTLPPAGSSTRPAVLVAGPGGRVDVYARGADGNLAFTGRTFTPFTGYTGQVRTAVADFTGDGVADYALATGPGAVAQARVIDGVTGGDVVRPTTVLGGFGNGAFVAAGDVDRDGKAELVVSTTMGGRAVELYRVADGRLQKVLEFGAFGARYARGARVAMGDVNRDGVADLIVGAGPNGPARVAVYDGAALAAGRVAELVPSFVAFGPLKTYGVNLAAGDVNGDGYTDVIVSQGAGGDSLVKVWSGGTIVANPGTPPSALAPLQQFYANGTTDRGGIRVSARDINGDGKTELVTAPSTDSGEWVRVLSVSGSSVDALAAVYPFRTQSVFAGPAVESAAPAFDNVIPPGGPCLCCRPGFLTPVCSRVV